MERPEGVTRSVLWAAPPAAWEPDALQAARQMTLGFLPVSKAAGALIGALTTEAMEREAVKQRAKLSRFRG